MRGQARIPDHFEALGIFAFHRLNEELQNPPTIAVCTTCGMHNKTSFYNVGWCDQCAAKAGYIPEDYTAQAELMLFRPMFQHARAQNHTWPALKTLVLYWEANKRLLCRGQFGPDFMEQVLDGRDYTTKCKALDCGKPLGHGAVAGFCGHTCYQRDYRHKNKESIKNAKIVRELRKAEEARKKQALYEHHTQPQHREV